MNRRLLLLFATPAAGSCCLGLRAAAGSSAVLRASRSIFAAEGLARGAEACGGAEPIGKRSQGRHAGLRDKNPLHDLLRPLAGPLLGAVAPGACGDAKCRCPTSRTLPWPSGTELRGMRQRTRAHRVRRRRMPRARPRLKSPSHMTKTFRGGGPQQTAAAPSGRLSLRPGGGGGVFPVAASSD